MVLKATVSLCELVIGLLVATAGFAGVMTANGRYEGREINHIA